MTQGVGGRGGAKAESETGDGDGENSEDGANKGKQLSTYECPRGSARETGTVRIPPTRVITGVRVE